MVHLFKEFKNQYMFLKIKLIIWMSILVISGLKAQELDRFQLEHQLKQHVSFLASDSLEGRGLGTEGKILAKHYIADKFSEFGLLPYNTEGYFQDFYVRIGMARVEATNVVGYLKGTDPLLVNEYIVIGAHYDHLGMEEVGHTIKIFHGADDNASGVAAMIELARYFSGHRDFLKRSVIFIAFDAEESGLLGSEHFAENNELVESSDIKAMFSLDMVGMYAANQGIDMKGISLLHEGEKLASDIARSYQISLKKMNDTVEPRTDTKSFGDEGIPAIHVFTGMKSPYHKPQDTFEKLDYEGMALITTFLGSLISELANMPQLKSANKMEKIQQDGAVKFNFGLNLLAGSSGHRFPDRFYTAKKILSFGVGMAAELKLPKNVGLQAEALYLGDGSKSSEGTFRRHSIMIPVNLNVYILNEMGGMFSTYVFGGPYFLQSFAGKNGGEEIDFTGLYNELEWGYQIGFGLDIMNWRVRGFWPVGLTNLHKDPEDVIKSKGGYFSIGYSF